ncbi:MAG: hypothetical protein OXF79_10785 [Chloroflexi bacterium]|nr:hypothetical protein [Chloroflexota bacterium]
MVTTTQPTVNDGLDNHIAFNTMRDQLESQHPNSWVVFHDQEFVGHYETYDAARQGARDQNLNLAHCLLQKLNASPTIVLSCAD